MATKAEQTNDAGLSFTTDAPRTASGIFSVKANSPLLKSLFAVQRSVTKVEKGSTNPHFKNSYADLNTVLGALRPALQEAGVLLMQAPVSAPDGMLALATILSTADERIEFVATTPLQKDDPQGVGSAITYLRRYSLVSIFALEAVDDDGEAASSGKTTLRVKSAKPKLAKVEEAEDEESEEETEEDEKPAKKTGGLFNKGKKTTKVKDEEAEEEQESDDAEGEEESEETEEKPVRRPATGKSLFGNKKKGGKR